MCLYGLLSKSLDKVWNFFENLALEIYEIKQARGALGCSTRDNYVFHISSYYHDHLQDSYDHPYYSHVPRHLCDYCESYDHDVHNCPYHHYIDTTCNLKMTMNYATHKMMKTM